VFASAGDDVGASPFVSAVANDEPTIDALNAMGLSVGAVGNHEFDKGFADLRDRIVPRTGWPNLGANVEGSNLPGSHVITTTGGVRMGFIGVVTEQTASLVSPDGIQGITFTDPVAAINREAGVLTDGNAANGEADVLVVLAHEGAAATATTPTDCAALLSRQDAFGRIVRDSSPEVDAIFGGHTHLPVSCTFPGLSRKGQRAVLEGGEYGQRISQLRLTYTKSTKTVSMVDPQVVAVTAAAFPAVDQEVDAIVKKAQAEARERGRPGRRPHQRRPDARPDLLGRRGPGAGVDARQLHRRRPARRRQRQRPRARRRSPS
jgi:5'-nucleotidase